MLRSYIYHTKTKTLCVCSHYFYMLVLLAPLKWIKRSQFVACNCILRCFISFSLTYFCRYWIEFTGCVLLKLCELWKKYFWSHKWFSYSCRYQRYKTKQWQLTVYRNVQPLQRQLVTVNLWERQRERKKKRGKEREEDRNFSGSVVQLPVRRSEPMVTIRLHMCVCV